MAGDSVVDLLAQLIGFQFKDRYGDRLDALADAFCRQQNSNSELEAGVDTAIALSLLVLH